MMMMSCFVGATWIGHQGFFNQDGGWSRLGSLGKVGMAGWSWVELSVVCLGSRSWWWLGTWFLSGCVGVFLGSRMVLMSLSYFSISLPGRLSLDGLTSVDDFISRRPAISPLVLPTFGVCSFQVHPHHLLSLEYIHTSTSFHRYKRDRKRSKENENNQKEEEEEGKRGGGGKSLASFLHDCWV